MLASISDLNDLDFRSSASGEQAKWVAEAQKWRLPYWDWALAGAKVPSIFASSSITIKDPKQSSGTVTIDNNPLYSFKMMVKNQQTAFDKLPAPYQLKDGHKGSPVRRSYHKHSPRLTCAVAESIQYRDENYAGIEELE